MKIHISAATFILVFLPSIVFAADISALRASDILCLKKALHNANQSQLEKRYQMYDDQMTSYLTDLPSCLNIWMNVNEIRSKHKETDQTRAILSLDMLASNADNAMTQHIATARTARENLVKITSLDALKQVDKNHQWDLPANVSEIRPAAGITKAKDLNPQILRQIPKRVY